jgi:hypothetical protein
MPPNIRVELTSGTLARPSSNHAGHYADMTSFVGGGRMDSLWQLGEGSGYRGREPAVYQILCAFCLERGNFKTVFHVEKKKPDRTL